MAVFEAWVFRGCCLYWAQWRDQCLLLSCCFTSQSYEITKARSYDNALTPLFNLSFRGTHFLLFNAARIRIEAAKLLSFLPG